MGSRLQAIQHHGGGVEENAVAGSGCLQCAAGEEQLESSTGACQRAERQGVHISVTDGAGGKGGSQKIAYGLQFGTWRPLNSSGTWRTGEFTRPARCSRAVINFFG